MAYDIFISYRRQGGADKARPVKSELENRKYRVFLDYDELKDGVFDERIMKAIEDAPVFLMILSAHSLDRCKNEDDWVRKEIEYALEMDRHIVPVNPNQEFNGFPEDIPESVKEGLGQHQFSHIDFGQLFKVSMDKMIRERIEPYLTSPKPKGALIRITTDLDCRIWCFGEDLGVAKAKKSHFDKPTEICLPEGDYVLTFVGLESEKDVCEQKLNIKDVKYAQHIEVKLYEQYQKRKEKEEQARIAKLLADGKGRDGVYKVGDYYNQDGKEGVVFAVSQDGRHGKIISLDQERLPWCTEAQFDKGIAVGAKSRTDGKENTDKVMARADSTEYPAFVWCRSKGEDWYLPTVEELLELSYSCKIVNQMLEGRGLQKINRGIFNSAELWSSEEAENGACFAYKMLMSFATADDDTMKYFACEVRAVAAF